MTKLNETGATAPQENTVENKTKKNSPIKTPKRKGFSPYADKYPTHITNMVAIVKNNAEIKRFTSLGIIAYLKNQGTITGNKCYVTFKWDRFVIFVDGFATELKYTNKAFLLGVTAAFNCFSTSALNTIDKYLRIESKKDISEHINMEEINDVVKMIETRNYNNTQSNDEQSDEVQQ